MKTYKLFIGGKFPRSESGRVFEASGAEGFNVPRGSRKRGAAPPPCRRK